MPIRRELDARSIELSDIKLGRVEPQYTKVLLRLLAAHALAERLTAQGYERAMKFVDSPDLLPAVEKNFAEERKHAALVYALLDELGVSQIAADRMMMSTRKGPSFEAPRRFAEHAKNEIDLLMASLSLDVTGLIMIGVNYKDSSYAPHCRAAELILEEEADHEQFAEQELSNAVNRLGRDKNNKALRQWVPRAANFFGPPGSGFTHECIRLGLKSKDNDELADLYLAMLERKVEQLGLEMPRLTSSYPHSVA
jgi:1,2-phenylacetyl-CoA epoxidase catalytic subunit